jgi:hypothetical protein
MFLGTDAPEPIVAKSERTQARESFFLEFAEKIRRDFPDLPLMVTGGFRSRAAMEAALAENGCDLIGLGRPAVMDPACPKNTLLNPQVNTEDAVVSVKTFTPPWIVQKIGIKALNAGGDSVSLIYSLILVLTETRMHRLIHHSVLVRWPDTENGACMMRSMSSRSPLEGICIRFENMVLVIYIRYRIVSGLHGVII